MHIHRIVLLALALAASCAAAQNPRELAWDDLKLQQPISENPFASLTEQQLQDLADVAGARARQALGVKPTPAAIAVERETVARLAKDGIDVDVWLAKREAIAERKRKAANAVNPALDKALVRLPGYLLPLDLTGKQVTEFLLVPWIGACIHTPPPPPNQIVHVTLQRPFEIARAFEPVWVTGRMSVNATRKEVYITDGASQIDVGYAIRSAGVERY